MSLPNRKKVILDVDTGSDDAVAIISAVLCDELNVLGVAVSFGNQELEHTLKNTLKVMELLGSDVPVFKGCGVPLAQDLLPGRRVNAEVKQMRAVVDGKEVAVHESFSLPEPKIREREEHACAWMLRTLKETTEKITVIPVGPMTNLAMTLRMDPRAADGIEEVVCMGGGVDIANITPSAEINFYNDPEAAKILLHSGVPVTVVGLDATHSSWFGYPEADRIAAVGNPAADFAASMLRHRISSANKIGMRKEEKSALHDVLAVCAAIDKTILTGLRREKCDVDIGGGAADGTLIVDRRPTAIPSRPNYIAYKADGAKLLDMLCTHLANYGKEIRNG